MATIKNKVIIITGASSGIGAETARLLVENGAKVVLCARREDRLKALAATLGENAAYCKADVASLSDLQNAVMLSKERFGGVDAVFANAGIMPASNVSVLKTDDWNAMIDINIRGVLNAVAAVMPEFAAKKRGHVIVTSSMAGLRSVPGNSVYSGTKHFVRAFMDSFRSESIQEGTNIKTTVIYPGAIKTELLNTVAPSETKRMVEQFYENVGIGAEAISGAVLYALTQSDNVDVSDIVVRPRGEA